MMAVSIGTMRALLLGMRDRVRDQLTLDENHCQVQPDGKPPAFSGEYYVAVHPDAFTLDDPEMEAWSGSLSAKITVTFKAGRVPADRAGTELIAAQDVVWDVSERVAKAVHDSQPLLATANAILGTGTQHFVEPLRLIGPIGPIQAKGPEWFGSKQTQGGAAGWAVELRFGKARRYEVLPAAGDD